MESIPPYSLGTHLGGPQDDPEGTALYNKLEEMLNDPAYAYIKPFIAAILNGIHGPPYSHEDIEKQINTILTQTYKSPGESVGHDVYMEFGLSSDMLLNFKYMIAEVTAGRDGYLPPDVHYTDMDAKYESISWWLYNKTGGVAPLGEALLNEIKQRIGSQGDPSQMSDLLNAILSDPNFFTNFPTVTPAAFSDLQSLTGLIGGKLPDFMLSYLEIYYNWPNPNQNAGDISLQQNILEIIQAQWNKLSLSDLQQMVIQNIIQPGFPDMPLLDIYGAQNLEKALNIPQSEIPPLQTQFFEARAFLNSCKPGTTAYSMAQSLVNEINSLWPSGSASSLQSWYNSTYSVRDPYMEYSDVDDSTIQEFYQIANNTTAKLQPTAADLNYLAVISYRDKFDPSTSDYKLMDALRNEWYQYGSNPTAAQQQAITKWAMQEVGSPAFINSTLATQQKFLSYCSYAVTLSYFSQYLINWGGGSQPKYIQEFAETMRSIISGYLQTHQSVSQADFQNYLNTNYSQNDFCFQFPGLNPDQINTLFATFGLQSPHVYGTIDDAYSMLSLYLQENNIDPNSPDGVQINAFYQVLAQGEAAYDPNNPNADLFKACNAQGWITNLENNTSVWNGLSPGTQQLFEAISHLEPSR